MSNDRTAVIILVKDFRIEGEIDLIPGARVTDFMNNANNFIVVTDVTVFGHDGKEVIRAHFINVLVSNIAVILPADSLK